MHKPLGAKLTPAIGISIGAIPPNLLRLTVSSCLLCMFAGCRDHAVPNVKTDHNQQVAEAKPEEPVVEQGDGLFDAAGVAYKPKLILREAGHTRALAFSPDGKTLTSCDAQDQISLWEGSTGKSLGTLGERGLGVRCLAFCRDGNLLATGDFECTIKLWDFKARTRIPFLEGHKHAVSCVAFSADGKTLASSGDRSIRIWDVSSGMEKAVFKGDGYTLAFDGKTLAWVADYLGVRVWDVHANTEKALLKQLNVHSLAFNNTSSILATGSSHADGPVQLWDMATLTSRLTLTWRFKMKSSLEAPVYNDCLAFHPDGYTLAACGGGRLKGPGGICVWNIGTGKCIARFMERDHLVATIAFSPDGALLASGHADGTIRLWDMAAILKTGNK